MKLTEVREILSAIAAYDRKPFPEGSDVAWLEILAGVPYVDAHQAVVEHYRMPDPQPIRPGDVRKRAATLAARRAPRRQLPAAPQRGERGDMAREAAREFASAAVRRLHERHPERKAYQHRSRVA